MAMASFASSLTILSFNVRISRRSRNRSLPPHPSSPNSFFLHLHRHRHIQEEEEDEEQQQQREGNHGFFTQSWPAFSIRKKRSSFSVSLGRRLGPTFSDNAKLPTNLLPSSTPDLVFEEGIFETDFAASEISDRKERNRSSYRIGQREAMDKEELVPEEWKFLQTELHKTKVQKKRESRMQEMENSQLKDLRVQIRRLRKVESGSSPTQDHLSPAFRPKFPEKDELLELEKVLSYRPLRKDHPDTEFEQMFTHDEKLQLKRRIPDFSLTNCEKWPALHVLVASGQYFFLEQFLNMGIDIDLNARDEDGYTALQRAVQGRKDIAVSQLLNAGADVNVCDEDGANLLHFSVQNSALNLVRLVIRHGVQINHADKYGWTPLHVAVLIGRSDIVRHLLVSGADKSLETKDGLTPLDIVLTKGRGKGGDGYAVAKALKNLPTINLGN